MRIFVHDRAVIFAILAMTARRAGRMMYHNFIYTSTGIYDDKFSEFSYSFLGYWIIESVYLLI